MSRVKVIATMYFEFDEDTNGRLPDCLADSPADIFRALKPTNAAKYLGATYLGGESMVACISDQAAEKQLKRIYPNRD